MERDWRVQRIWMKIMEWRFCHFLEILSLYFRLGYCLRF